MRRSMLAVFLCAVPLLAGNNEEFRPPTQAELQLKSTPLAPGASAVVLDWVRKEDDSLRWASTYLRIKVLTEDGRKYGDVEIPYLPWKFDATDIKARTIQPDGTIVPFNGKIFDKVIIRHGGLKLNAKTFSLPDVHAGTIVEYSWTHRWTEPDFSGVRWNVQREIPVLHESAWFRPYTGSGVGMYTIFSLSKGLPPGKKMVKQSCCYEIELENFPPIDNEPFGPPEASLQARVYLLYTQPVSTTKEYWDQTGRFFADDIEDFLGRPSSLETEVMKAMGDASTPEAKLHRIYSRAQQVRNLSFEVEKTETEAKRDRTKDNKSSIDVVRNGYGYRYQINRAFVTMARAAGFDAHIVCVSDRGEDFFQNTLPDASAIAEEIAQVVVDGKPRYFDPGTPYMPFGMLQWQNSSLNGLRIERKSNGTWVEIPYALPAESPIARTADLRFDGEVVKGKVIAQYGGLEAQHRRFNVRNDDETAARTTLQDEAKKWFPEGAAVTVKNVAALRTADEPLVVEYEVELPSWGAATGSRLLLPLSLFQSNAKNELSSEKRKTALYFPYSYSVADRVTLHLPQGAKVEGLPAASALDLKALAYDFHYEAKPDAVELKRNVTVQVNMLSADLYPTVRNFFTKLAAADHESVVLQKAR